MQIGDSLYERRVFRGDLGYERCLGDEIRRHAWNDNARTASAIIHKRGALDQRIVNLKAPVLQVLTSDTPLCCPGNWA